MRLTGKIVVRLERDGDWIYIQQFLQSVTQRPAVPSDDDWEAALDWLGEEIGCALEGSVCPLGRWRSRLRSYLPCKLNPGDHCYLATTFCLHSYRDIHGEWDSDLYFGRFKLLGRVHRHGRNRKQRKKDKLFDKWCSKQEDAG